MLLHKILALRILVLSVLAVGVTSVSSLEAAPEKPERLLGTNEFSHLKRDITGHRISGISLSEQELEAIYRYQRQIKFKESYEDLPEGLPQKRSNGGGAHPHNPFFYFVQVDLVQEPLTDIPIEIKKIPKGANTYFPPEVIPLDLLHSNDDDEGDSQGFFILPDEQESIEAKREGKQVEAEHDKHTNSVNSPKFSELLAFYIPVDGSGYDSTYRHTTTEEPFFLAKDFSTDSSHSTSSPPNLSQSAKVREITYSTTPLPSPSLNSHSLRESKELTHDLSSVEVKDSDSKSDLHTALKPSLTPSNAQASVISAPLTTPSPDTPFFIVNYNTELPSNDKDASLPPKNIQVEKYTPVLDITEPPKSLPLPIHSYTITPPKTLSSPFKQSHIPRNKAAIITFPPPLKSSHRNVFNIPQSSSGFPKSLKSQRRHKNEPPSSRSAEDSKRLDNSAEGIIPGISGRDYPIFEAMPETRFDCSSKAFGGYYADPETKCQVFHVCLGRKSAAFLCPVGTLFNQKLLVCDWWYNVDCPKNLRQRSQHGGIFSGSDTKRKEDFKSL